ncbi:MAG TPA: DNA-deoxyinosine glycosylase [Caulobacteraceae bacterium]
MRKRSFPPVVDPATRLLVLGSLPGEASLKAGRYYAHPRNLFWALMGEVLEVDLVQLDYDDRLATLLKNGVGLWDVVAEAVRPGSMDSAITGAVENDLLTLVRTLPNLKAVAFNGAASAKVGMRQLEPVAGRIALTRMPSTSPAYAGREGLKREAWMGLRAYL